MSLTVKGYPDDIEGVRSDIFHALLPFLVEEGVDVDAVNLESIKMSHAGFVEVKVSRP